MQHPCQPPTTSLGHLLSRASLTIIAALTTFHDFILSPFSSYAGMGESENDDNYGDCVTVYIIVRHDKYAGPKATSTRLQFLDARSMERSKVTPVTRLAISRGSGA